MITIEEHVPEMTEVQLDAFPHGIIRLDRRGTILYYNHAASALSGLSATSTVGLNFFTDVAPCAAVRNFQGRFIDFIAKPGNRIEQFAFLFRFSWGDKAVRITFVCRAHEDERIFIVVNAAAAAAE